jgi:hypothetical protein
MFQVRLNFPVTLIDCFANILGLLCHNVAAQGPARGLPASLVALICARIDRLATRLERLLSRNPAALPKPRKDPPPPRPAALRRAHNLLPSHFGWLRRMLPGTIGNAAAAQFPAAQLNYLLSDPEIQAALLATPALGRVIRPLCRMLGITPPAGLRTPPPKPPAPAQRPDEPATIHPRDAAREDQTTPNPPHSIFPT